MPNPTASEPPVFGCSCHRLRKLTRLMSLRYDQALAPAGVNVNQFAILRRAQAQPRSISALALELGMDRTTLSRDLKPLVAAGWVVMRRCADDARQRHIEVTLAGNDVITLARPLWRDAQTRIETLLGHDQVSQLHAALDHATGQLTP